MPTPLSPARHCLPALSLVAGVALAAPVHAQEPEPRESSETSASAAPASDGAGLRKRRGFLNLSPGLLAITLNNSIRVYPLYVWGIDGGYHLPIGRVFALQAGGFFEHALYTRSIYLPGSMTNGRSSSHLFRMGPQLRVGGGNEKIYGYGLARLGVDILHFSGGDLRNTGAAFHSSLGGGVMGLLIDKVLLGGEVAVDITANNSVFALMRFRVFVGFAF
jgi:hypothetical protein